MYVNTKRMHFFNFVTLIFLMSKVRNGTGSLNENAPRDIKLFR